MRADTGSASSHSLREPVLPTFSFCTLEISLSIFDLQNEKRLDFCFPENSTQAPWAGRTSRGEALVRGTVDRLDQWRGEV